MEKTRNYLLKSLFAVFILFTIGLAASQVVHAKSVDIKPVGTVTFTTGDTSIVRADKSVVKAAKNDAVNAGDTIETKNGRLQLSLIDGGKVSLQPNTIYKINKYEFSGKEDGSEYAFTELLKGGMRTISGLIGHKNRERYQLKTAVATIGIRGTEFTANYETILKMTTNHGSVDVCNITGCLNANTGQTIEVAGPNDAPKYSKTPAVARTTPPNLAKKVVANNTTESSSSTVVANNDSSNSSSSSSGDKGSENTSNNTSYSTSSNTFDNTTTNTSNDSSSGITDDDDTVALAPSVGSLQAGDNLGDLDDDVAAPFTSGKAVFTASDPVDVNTGAPSVLASNIGNQGNQYDAIFTKTLASDGSHTNGTLRGSITTDSNGKITAFQDQPTQTNYSFSNALGDVYKDSFVTLGLSSGNAVSVGLTENLIDFQGVVGQFSSTSNLLNLASLTTPVTYNVLGSTGATAISINNSVVSATTGSSNSVTGSLTVNFNTLNYGYNLNNITVSSNTFSIVGSNLSLVSGSSTFNGAGVVTSDMPTTCSPTCGGNLNNGSVVQGAFFGPNAERTGLQYSFSTNGIGDVTGSVVLGR